MKLGKKGFSSVFLSMIFGSMILLTFSFVNAAASKAMESSCDAVFSLAGQSILSEFDLTLKEKYGLIAIGLNNNEIENRLFYYANATFKSVRKLNMIPVEVEGIGVDMKGYSMIDVDVFENAVIQLMKFNLITSNEKQPQIKENQVELNMRILRNGVIQESLPSKGVKGSSLVLQIIEGFREGSLKEAFYKSGKGFLVNRYIFQYFKNNKNSRTADFETFFANEIEYILYGEFSDEENKKKFNRDFIELRTALNLIYIYTDKIKVKEIAALASIITPGPAAIGTQAIIAAAWAYAEAINDGKLISAGKKVALIKTRQNWAIDLKFYKDMGSEYIEPLKKEGYLYEDYLKIFLYLTDREIKLLRVMDLIQMNLIGNYDEGFLMSNYYSGFSYGVFANGKKFEYKEKF